MKVKEILRITNIFGNSYKDITIMHKDGSVVWTDWNGEKHTATTSEELWNQLRKAPLCQKNNFAKEQESE